jgi:hypothetical protein
MSKASGTGPENLDHSTSILGYAAKLYPKTEDEYTIGFDKWVEGRPSLSSMSRFQSPEL